MRHFLQLLAGNLQLFEQTTMFLRLDQLVSKKLQKVSNLVKTHEKSKTNRKISPFWCLLPLFTIFFMSFVFCLFQQGRLYL